MNPRKPKPWTWLGVTFYLVMSLGIHAMQLRNGGCNGKCACVLSVDTDVRMTERSASEADQPYVPGTR